MSVKLEKFSVNQLYKQVAHLTHERDELQRKYDDLVIASATVISDLQGKVEALAVESAQLRTAIEFATAPDMWVEQHNGMLDYRYAEWYVDVLNTALETPVTEAVIAEFLSSKWVAGNIPPEFKKYYVRYVTDAGPQFCIAKWFEYDPCVPSDRRIRIWLPEYAKSIHGLENVTHYHELPEFKAVTNER